MVMAPVNILFTSGDVRGKSKENGKPQKFLQRESVFSCRHNPRVSRWRMVEHSHVVLKFPVGLPDVMYIHVLYCTFLFLQTNLQSFQRARKRGETLHAPQMNESPLCRTKEIIHWHFGEDIKLILNFYRIFFTSSPRIRWFDFIRLSRQKRGFNRIQTSMVHKNKSEFKVRV